MSIIYLSPSPKPSAYLGGGDDRTVMNQLADAMGPVLRANGIKCVRSKSNSSLAQVIRESNSEFYDLHLALYSNTSPESMSGKLMGSDIYYFTYGNRAKKAAEVIADNYRKIYPHPDLVKTVPTTQIPEITKTSAPALLIQCAYHDNEEDVKWLQSNITAIALNLVEGITRYFEIPFLDKAQPVTDGLVNIEKGRLSIHRKPDANADIIMQVPNRAKIFVLGMWNDWYIMDYKGYVGYAAAKYVEVRK